MRKNEENIEQLPGMDSDFVIVNEVAKMAHMQKVMYKKGFISLHHSAKTNEIEVQMSDDAFFKYMDGYNLTEVYDEGTDYYELRCERFGIIFFTLLNEKEYQDYKGKETKHIIEVVSKMTTNQKKALYELIDEIMVEKGEENKNERDYRRL